MFDWSTFALSFVTSGVISTGTAAGLSKILVDRSMTRYKAELDRELETHRDKLEQNRKLIEAKTGRRTYVSQVQFDAEFSSLKDCFAAAGKLRLAFNGLLPMGVTLSIGDEDERLKALHSQVTDMAEKYNVFVDVTETLFPFFPEEISVKFEICAGAAFRCMQHIRADYLKALRSGHLDADGLREQFQTAYSQAANMTRSRFDQLSVLPITYTMPT